MPRLLEVVGAMFVDATSRAGTDGISRWSETGLLIISSYMQHVNQLVAVDENDGCK